MTREYTTYTVSNLDQVVESWCVFLRASKVTDLCQSLNSLSFYFLFIFYRCKVKC